MKKLWFLLSIVVITVLFTACECETPVEEEQKGEQEAALETLQPYPMVEPYDQGFLKVTDTHELYWEVSGNPEGYPVIGLHGGPGSTARPEMRTFFDPERFKIILFDQRGAGRSKPAAEWRENNTQVLVEDINTLRDHLGVEGPAMIFGGSWGSTLAVAYAETHPDLVSGLVLRGIFLGSKAEIDYFYHGGAAKAYPENFAKLQAVVPNPEELNYPQQLFDMTQSEDPAVREKAIKGWAFYEIMMVSLDMTEEMTQQIVDEYDLTTFSVLENWYMAHGCFVDDTQLLDNADKIAHIPTYIVNGTEDHICPPVTAKALYEKFDNAKIELPHAAHSLSSPAIAQGLLRGVKWVSQQIGVE